MGVLILCVCGCGWLVPVVCIVRSRDGATIRLHWKVFIFVRSYLNLCRDIGILVGASVLYAGSLGMVSDLVKYSVSLSMCICYYQRNILPTWVEVSCCIIGDYVFPKKIMHCHIWTVSVTQYCEQFHGQTDPIATFDLFEWTLHSL